MTNTFRVLLRGRFDDPDEPTRARLRAVAADHGLLSAAFTEDGTLTYEAALLGFTFRCAVTLPDDAEVPDAEAHARRGAEVAVRAFGCGCRDLRLDTTSMRDVPVRRRTAG